MATVTKIHPCDKHWTGPIPEGCPDCKMVHTLRVTVEDHSPRPWSKQIEVDIDPADYDPENYTLGSLVWDAWTVTAWPLVKQVLDNVDLHDDMRVTVTFDGEYVADERPQHVTEDLFTASWVAQHDLPLHEVPTYREYLDSIGGR